MEKQYFIAKDHNQFVHYAYEMGFTREQSVFVDRHEKLAGLRLKREQVHFVGAYWLNKDWLKLREAIESRLNR